jgi:hypothetical protein
MACLQMRLVAATGASHEQAHDRPPPGRGVCDGISLRRERTPLRIALELRQAWVTTSPPAAGQHLTRPRTIATRQEVLLRLAEGQASIAKARNIGAAFLRRIAPPVTDCAAIPFIRDGLIAIACTGDPRSVSRHVRRIARSTALRQRSPGWRAAREFRGERPGCVRRGSQAADVDHGQFVGWRLKDVAVVADLAELGPVGGPASRR